jgi:hypothetical protein
MASTELMRRTASSKGINADKKDTMASFGELFLDGYLSKGFGTLNKREVDLLVLQSMLQSRYQGPFDTVLAEIDEVELSRELKVRTSRVRSMLTDLQYRHMPSEETLNERLKAAISSGEYDQHSNVIRLQIPNILVREHAKRLARGHGIVDKALDSSIIQMQPRTFVALGLELLSEEFEKQVFQSIPKAKLRGAETSSGVIERILTYVGKNATSAVVGESLKKLFAYIQSPDSLDFLQQLAENSLGAMT